jgi:hypothetical protein
MPPAWESGRHRWFRFLAVTGVSASLLADTENRCRFQEAGGENECDHGEFDDHDGPPLKSSQSGKPATLFPGFLIPS